MKKFSEKQTGILARSDLRTPKGKIIYWCFFAILVCVCLIAIIPMIWTIATSFKSVGEIYDNTSFFPKNIGISDAIKRISYVWKILDLGRSMINTIILSIGSCLITLIVCGFGGYAISKIKPKGFTVVTMLVLWTIMMPGQIRTVPQYMSFLNFPFASTSYGMGVSILDTYWPMWLGTASSAYTVLLFKNAFDGLSDSYVEAARIDGATNIDIFFRIMFPLSIPIVVYVSIGIINGTWSNFFTPYLVLSDSKLYVTPLKIYLIKMDSSIKINDYLMGLIFATIPPFIMFAIFQKQIMGGINVGGVKG